MKPVERSSNIAAVGHDPEKNELWVKFKGTGGMYVYQEVDADQHKAFMDADSLGHHFHLNIKGQRPHRKHDGD
jgi:hypothetical protein